MSSAVAAAATMGVTGLTLTWAVRTTPPASASFNTGSGGDQTTKQIAADQQTIAQLKASIDSTNQLLDGTTGAPPATVAGGVPASPTTPGSTTLGAAGTSAATKTGSVGTPSQPGNTSGSVGGAHPAAGTGAPAATPGAVSPGGTTSGGGSTTASPAPTSPPATTPAPVVTTPAPPVATTTGASPAKP